MLLKDLKNGIFEDYYIHFSLPVTRNLLEEFANQAYQENVYNKIKLVYDQYLNFLCIEQNLFDLQQQNTYFHLNSTKFNDVEIQNFIDGIVAGVMPIIRAAKGNAAELIAKKLDAKLRDFYVNPKNEFFAKDPIAPRPLLILLDRNLDIASMLCHTWSYQCLIHDTLSLQSNRIQLKDASGQQKSFDLDVEQDFFWKANAEHPFPKMAENVDTELSKYKKDVDTITASCGVESLDQIHDNGDSGITAKGLKLALEQLPKLTERKRILDMHMFIATTILKIIQERSLDKFILAEETLNKMNKSLLMEWFQDSKKGSIEDKLRLFLLYYLSLENELSKSDMEQLENSLITAGGDISAVKYIKNLKALGRMAASLPTSSISKSGDIFSSIRGTVMGNTFESVVSGIKNILPGSKNLPVTRIVEMFMDGPSWTSGSTGTTAPFLQESEYLFLDPKVSNRNTGHSRGTSGSKSNLSSSGKVSFQQAVVFVVGGGNFFEYQNLQEWVQANGQGKSVIYGSTEILSPSNFLDQLSNLGKESK